MNGKKLIVFGAIALMVIGFVIAAGCTATQDQTRSTPTATGTEIIDKMNEFVGTWHGKSQNGDSGTIILKEDMTGTMMGTKGDTGETITRSLIWVLSENGKYILMEYSDDKTLSVRLNVSDDGKSLSDLEGSITFTKK